MKIKIVAIDKMLIQIYPIWVILVVCIINLAKNVSSQDPIASNSEKETENIHKADNNQDASLVRLTASYNLLEKQVETMCIANIINAIRSQQFDTAEMQLESMNKEEENIPLIIGKVFNKNAENLQVLLEFSKTVATIDRKVNILTSTWNEIKIINDVDPHKIIEFLETFETEIISHSNYTHQEYPYMVKIKNDATDLLKTSAGEILEFAMIKDTYGADTKTLHLANNMYGYNNTIFKETLLKVIESVYDRIKKPQLVNNIYKTDMGQLRLEMLTYLYQKIKTSKDQEIEATLNLCRNMIRTNHPENLRQTINEISSNSKTSALPNIFHIRNSKYSKYLYVDPNLYDVIRLENYDIATTTDESFERQSSWYIVKDEGSEGYFFKNYYDESKYMYASDKTIDGNYMVFQMNDGELFQKNKVWTFEIKDNEMLIKNVEKKGYLCDSLVDRWNGKRIAYLLKEEDYNSTLTYCKWTVEACLWP